MTRLLLHFSGYCIALANVGSLVSFDFLPFLGGVALRLLLNSKIAHEGEMAERWWRALLGESTEGCGDKCHRWKCHQRKAIGAPVQGALSEEVSAGASATGDCLVLETYPINSGGGVGSRLFC